MKRVSTGLLAAAALFAVLLACQVAHAACKDANCKTCEDEAVCTECNDKYRLNTTNPEAPTCQPCDDKQCLKCDAKKNECTKCDAGYKVNVDTKVCEKEGEVVPPADCNGIAGCKECSTETPKKCTKCNEGFRLIVAGEDGTDKCEACKVAGCIQCGKDVAVCEKCKSGQQPSGDGKACEKTDAAAGATMLPLVGALVAAAGMVLAVSA